jgi:septation ring formation regulator EzrA|tara:strand:- start:578 stop:784 length:207 start_codon:yes stop_codon:yes gene_type:complete
MNYEFIAMVLGSGGGILATWVKMTNDVTKIKARLYALEKTETKAQQTLEVLVEGVNEIKLLLAKKGIE